MGFKDFSKPKWKNRDPSVRREAVRNISDKGLLLNIIKKDLDIIVRQEAISNLNDDDTLIRLMSDDLGSYLKKHIMCLCMHALS